MLGVHRREQRGPCGTKTYVAVADTAGTREPHPGRKDSGEAQQQWSDLASHQCTSKPLRKERQMELMQAVEHYATAMKLAERHGNKHGDVDAANNAWNECKKAADELAELRAWRVVPKNFDYRKGVDQCS